MGRVELILAIVLLGPTLVAGPVLAQEIGGTPWELDIHATGMLGRRPIEIAHPFEEVRVLVGGIALAELTPRWGLGGGLEIGASDESGSTLLYHARVQRRLAWLGGLELVAAAGVGGLTIRGPPNLDRTKSNWLVPLALGLDWHGPPGSRWGARLTFTDWVVIEKESVLEGGNVPTRTVRESYGIHFGSVSAGVTYRLGGR